ncbi:mannosyl-3-phosphoglycerate phosphatase-related protein [Kosakonia sp. MUSA4]|uniref:mannosyl-3-phosphoglycerate phosphatase-related protein n=1 Tax=Kosakonia sp. MUSA4 TaxID=2067958 RepID=UPI0015990EFB|nr:mannosyl-3-phosphoglycerate phosphatase-related protein [Kosakonia sp. MUSA4]QJT81465.1 mannosyl-3-phosphoglycerate phosphatase-related protein [Kosakonia sp. MUSA4]
MIGLNSSLLIISDLDGSLLDHHDYNWNAARQWLARLKQFRIPLIICSSKTAAEIVPLQEQLGIAGSPFIAENGARVVMTGEATGADTPGEEYRGLCRNLEALRSRFCFTGFHELSDADVADCTGLTLAEARLSRLRAASEVLLWRDDEQRLEDFRIALAGHGLALTRGGRFWHVMPEGCDKGHALLRLQQQLEQQEGKPRITIGLGDGPNDVPMLARVDYAVVIKGAGTKPVVLPRADEEHVYYTTLAGPEGWREGLDYFLLNPAMGARPEDKQ